MDARPILIIGSKGQLGRDCLELWNSSCCDVLGLDLPEIDIGDRGQCHRLLDKHNPKSKSIKRKVNF